MRAGPAESPSVVSENLDLDQSAVSSFEGGLGPVTIP